MLKPGFTLPPLMLSVDEVEALTLGALWVGAARPNSELAKAAEGALAKLAARDAARPAPNSSPRRRRWSAPAGRARKATRI